MKLKMTMKKPPTPEKIVKCLQKLKISYGQIVIDRGLPISLNNVGIWNMNYNHIRISKSSLDEHEDLSDKIAEVMSELSMGYVIMYVGKDVGWLYIQLQPSEDGTTNITADVIQAIIDKMNPTN